jgi:homoserine acetyltransferase
MLLPGQPNFEVVQSQHGHDGFLIEVEQVGKFIAQALS